MSVNNILSKYQRVSKGNPCSICGKPDWCLVSSDGKTAICARVQSDKPAGSAGWLHVLTNELPPMRPLTIPVKQSPIASISIRDTTFRALISILPLSEVHKQKLMARGLTESQITSLGYRTLPLEDRRDIVHKLQSIDIQLQYVPGFWCDDSGKWRLAGQPGILIPVRDIQGRICGAQIRCDDTSDGKYKWLSPASKPNGCGSGAPIHVSFPGQCDKSEIWITEGPLKADIARIKLNRIVLAIPGVATWVKAIPIITTIKSKSVVVALDMDKLTNPTVELYKNLLIERLVNLKINVFEANWNPNYKGLDDLLALGELKW